MKITLIMVMTADGKIAKSEDHNSYTWNSDEDKKHFRQLSSSFKVMFMGSTTYRAAGRKTFPGRTAYVFTRNPDKYPSLDGVNFTSESPVDLVNRLSAEGVTEATLIGGATINGMFFKENLVDEIVLTIEPKLFGKGISLIEGIVLDLDLKLVKSEQLNNKGTLLLTYQVQKHGSV